MKYKLPSNRQQIKFLKKLLNTNTSYNGGFLLDKTFYLLFKLSKSEVTQILNALEDKKLIKIIPPSPINSLPWIKIEQKAFSYIHDLRDNLFRFWIPIVISSGISIAAIIVSILALLLSLQSLTQWLKAHIVWLMLYFLWFFVFFFLLKPPACIFPLFPLVENHHQGNTYCSHKPFFHSLFSFYFLFLFCYPHCAIIFYICFYKF